MELYPYQKEGAAFLANHTRALLADTMGLGKTAQAIVAARKVAPDKGPAAILVVCPASVVENWKREFAVWWGSEKPEPLLVVTSYDRLTRNPNNYRAAYFVVILDEAHYLKNPKAKRTKAVFGKRMSCVGGIVENARRIWALTGTPAPNNPSELWPMLHAMAPGTILGIGKDAYTPRNFWSFTRRYCVVRNNGFGEQIVRGQRLDELKEKMSPFVLRRRKEEVLKDLPEIRFGELPLSSDAALRALSSLDHDDVARLKSALSGGAEALSKLSTEMATVRRLTALAKAPLVAEWVKEWLDACEQKIVIFAQHREAIEALGNALSNYHPAIIHGGTTSVERQTTVEAFQTNALSRVFIGQIQAAGTGITLTAASDLIFLEQSWTPADNAQAAMRIHRIGQKRGCLVRTATLAGSIDEDVQRVLARKTEDIVALFDAVA